MSTQTNNQQTHAPGKGVLWLCLLILLLLSFAILAAKRGYDTRFNHLEKQQQVSEQASSEQLEAFEGKLRAFTVDDSKAGGSVVVGDGSSGGGSGAASAAGQKGEKGDTGNAGEKGQDGQDGVAGPAGATGPQGLQGPQGPSGVASCPNGNCLSLQGVTPGSQEVGSINISGDGIFGGNVSQLQLVVMALA